MVGHAQGMFIGETLCLLAFKIGLLCAVAKRPVSGTSESFSPFIFALPALCDCLATSTMYLGLTMTVTNFQENSEYNDIHPPRMLLTHTKPFCYPSASPCCTPRAAGARPRRRLTRHTAHKLQYASVFQMLRGSAVVFTGIPEP